MKRIALVLAFVMLAIARGSAADDTIRIGIVGQFTGPFALSGAQSRPASKPGSRRTARKSAAATSR